MNEEKGSRGIRAELKREEKDGLVRNLGPEKGNTKWETEEVEEISFLYFSFMF